jgi:spore coat protein CotH
LIEVTIELPAEDWDKLCQQTRDIRTAFSGSLENPFTYFKGNITIDGVKIESVAIRKKGFIGSLDNQFPSLKVKFDEYVDQKPVAGIDVLTLNNNKQDPGQVSQFLTYRLFNAAGVHAPRVNFAKVTVNGEYLGIYSHVESIGKPFLKRRFGNNSGNLYEGTLADFYPKAIDRLEVKTNEKNHDRSKALRLAELLVANDELALDEVEKLVDLDNFLKFWVVESLIGFWDGYTNNQNNFWVYENRDNGKFYFMPWGADAAFMGFRGPFGGFGQQGPTSVYAESMLANRLYNDKTIADRYRQTMQEVLRDVWKEDELVKSIDRIETLLTDHLHDRQQGAPRAMDGVRRFIQSRRETIEAELQDWPVAVASQPRKPMYTVEVGSAKGSFTTEWRDGPVANPQERGRADIQLKLDGQAVAFKQLGATAHLAEIPQFPFAGRGGPPGRGGPARNPGPDGARRGGAPPNRPRVERFDGGPFGQMQPPATVVITGIRDSDSRPLTINLTADPKIFAASAGKTINVQGSLAEGQGGGNFFMPFGGRVIEGQLTLAKVGINTGDAIEGEFDLKIAETRGGFMDRRADGRGAARRDALRGGGRGGGGSPGGPGRGRGGPGGPGFGFGGPGSIQRSLVTLVAMREVQDELSATESQRKQLPQVHRELQEQIAAAMSSIDFQDVFNLPEDERNQQFQSLQRKLDEANQTAEKKLDTLLDTKQRARLKQLALQREGPDAFGRPDVIRQLGISDQQQEKIREIQFEFQPQFGFGPIDMSRIEEDRRKALAAVLAELTGAQKTEWTAMTGKEFRFPRSQEFGGPGGFAPGRGGPDENR